MAREMDSKLRCGIVMPISDSDDYPVGHWQDVLSILQASTRSAGFEASLVSDADGINIIHKSIVQNLYFNDLILCDVSAKNPNVMIELGMRLAFDKPTIIVKDDATRYPFDASSLEYIEYRKDLRFSSIEKFSLKLKSKMEAVSSQLGNGNYNSFLRTFGDFQLPNLKEHTVPAQDFIIDKLHALQVSVERLARSNADQVINSSVVNRPKDFIRWLVLPNASNEVAKQIYQEMEREFPKIPFYIDRDLGRNMLGVDVRTIASETLVRIEERFSILTGNPNT